MAWGMKNAYETITRTWRFSQTLRGYPVRTANVFRLAGERWSEMSPEQKKPYVDAANKVKRMKQQDNDNERKGKSKARGKETKTRVSTKSRNQKV